MIHILNHHKALFLMISNLHKWNDIIKSNTLVKHFQLSLTKNNYPTSLWILFILSNMDTPRCILPIYTIKWVSNTLSHCSLSRTKKRIDHDGHWLCCCLLYLQRFDTLGELSNVISFHWNWLILELKSQSTMLQLSRSMSNNSTAQFQVDLVWSLLEDNL